MENSILDSTKKILGLASDYTAFDTDVLTFINGALSTADQIGVSMTMTSIDSNTTDWSDLGVDPDILSMLKNYVYLKSQMLFDPPSTSFVIDAKNKQIEEFEWRMRARAEALSHQGEAV